MRRTFLNLIPYELIKIDQELRKTENYAGFISKSGTDELKMNFFFFEKKNPSILRT